MGKIKNIYCNGDSFTAGIGLADFKIPTYAGPFSIKNEQNDLKLKFLEYKRNYLKTHYASYDDILEYSSGKELKISDTIEYENYVMLLGNWKYIEKKHAWPKKLERNTPFTVYNDAMGGNSMQSILHSTVLGINELEKKGVFCQLAIIQITSIFRTEFYSSDHPWYAKPRGYRLRDLDEFSDDPYGSALKEYYRVQDDLDLIVKYFYTLATLNEFVKSKTGRYPIYIDAEFGKDVIKFKDILLEKFENTKEQELVKLLVEISRVNEINTDLMFSFTKDVVKPWENCGHYSEEIHELTAKKIAQLIEKLQDDELFNTRLAQIREKDPFIYD